tara:strand:+ start:203 stop:484 length:282 start_codon:yes stop_codon:yes gene_type:complete
MDSIFTFLQAFGGAFLAGLILIIALFFYKIICLFLSNIILSAMSKNNALIFLFGLGGLFIILPFTLELPFFMVILGSIMLLVGMFILNPNIFD